MLGPSSLMYAEWSFKLPTRDSIAASQRTFPCISGAMAGSPCRRLSSAMANAHSQHGKLSPGKLHMWYADHQEVILPDGHRFPMVRVG
jgi:hypothetical protein